MSSVAGDRAPLLAAEGLAKSYRSGPRTIRVLEGLDLSVAAGQSVAVAGVSGVGKSTLLHLLGGLDRPDAGSLRFDGRDVFDGDDAALRRYRNREVGFVFQFHHLLPEFSAQENVEMPLRIAGRAAEARDRARELLDRLGLAERADHDPARLSGGEQQRVAIARALATSPRLVLADEPTGNLDPSTGGRVFDLLRELQEERAFALVLATHSERLARSCGTIHRLAGGTLSPLGEREIAEYFQGVGADPDPEPML